MAYAYREKFKKDFMIDLVGYRRFGHNEGDEPSYTQPKMYETIREHSRVRELWAQELQSRGVIEEGEAESLVEEIQTRMEEIHENPSDVERRCGSKRSPSSLAPRRGPGDGRIPEDRLKEINDGLLERPEGFAPNDKLERLFAEEPREPSNGECGLGPRRSASPSARCWRMVCRFG